MHSARPAPSQSFLEKMLALGYQITPRGACVGFNMMWIQEVLTGDADKFNERMELIDRLPARNLRVKARKIHKDSADLSDDDKKILDILNFFQNITYYQSPEHFTDQFGEKLSQSDREKISQVTASIKLKNLGGLNEHSLAPKMYTEPEFKEYLHHLSELIKKLNPISEAKASEEKPSEIILRLGDYDHSIALRFNIKENAWIICDTESLIDLMTPHLQSPEQIAQKLFSHFHAKDFLAFKPFLYTARYTPSFLEEIKKFDASHPITEAMKRSITSDNITLALIAARRAADKELAKSLANIAEEKTGNTPLHYAVQPIIQKDNDAKEIHSAKQNALNDILNLLACGAQVNLKNAAGKTPITLLIENNDWNLLVHILMNIQTLEALQPSDQKLVTMNSIHLEKAFSNIIKLHPENYKNILPTIAREENVLGIILKAKPRGFFARKKKLDDMNVSSKFWELIKMPVHKKHK